MILFFVKITYIYGNNENQFDRNVDVLTNRVYKTYSQISCTRVSVVLKFRNSDSNRKLNVTASWYIFMCSICHTWGESSNFCYIFEAEITRLNDDDRLQCSFFQDFRYLNLKFLKIFSNDSVDHQKNVFINWKIRQSFFFFWFDHSRIYDQRTLLLRRNSLKK